MDSFQQLIGMHFDEVSLDESDDFILVKLPYFTKHCGKRYPSSKLKISDIDYFNLISFSELFRKETLFIIWYFQDTGTVTDLEIYYISNDFDILFNDYVIIKKAINNGEVHHLREGDTKFLGAARLNEKVKQPNSEVLSNRREFVFKKRYLQKILDEISY